MEPVLRRIEVDPELPPVAIDGRLLSEMYNHAREIWPEECCGLLTGREPGARFRQAHRCRNEMTRLHRSDPVHYPRDGRRAFYMNELDYLRVRDRAEAQGGKVTGIYHSHVGAGAYFSELDQRFAQQELFPFPEADHIVIAILDRRVTGAALFRRDAARGFVGRALVPRSP